MTIKQLKDEALEAVSRLFRADGDEQEQVDALEEVQSLCEENAMVLREQIRQTLE